MESGLYQRLVEAKELLDEVESWDEEAINSLPGLYEERAREYRGLTQRGED